MFFSIIINTHNQNKSINRCVESCLNQNFAKEFEIILIDTSDNKIENELKNIHKIKYFHYKSFSKFPVIDQLYKVYEGYKRAKGKWFCLLDGDDFFKRDKLNHLYQKYNLKNKILVQDRCSYFSEIDNSEKLYSQKNYKNFYFYKKFINFWPEIYGTSCLSGNMEILKFFFNDLNINKWTSIAIDAQLSLYALNNNILINEKEIFTVKSINENNLDNKFSKNNKLYWDRRMQQILFWENLTKKKINNLDKVLTKFFMYLNR